MFIFFWIEFNESFNTSPSLALKKRKHTEINCPSWSNPAPNRYRRIIEIKFVQNRARVGVGATHQCSLSNSSGLDGDRNCTKWSDGCFRGGLSASGTSSRAEVCLGSRAEFWGIAGQCFGGIVWRDEDGTKLGCRREWVFNEWMCVSIIAECRRENHVWFSFFLMSAMFRKACGRNNSRIRMGTRVCKGSNDVVSSNRFGKYIYIFVGYFVIFGAKLLRV